MDEIKKWPVQFPKYPRYKNSDNHFVSNRGLEVYKYNLEKVLIHCCLNSQWESNRNVFRWGTYKSVHIISATFDMPGRIQDLQQVAINKPSYN